jgi:hypothetical protein
MHLSLALCLVAAGGAAPAPEVEGLSAEARAEYEQKYLDVGDQMAADGDSSTRYRVYQGKYRKSITEADFYRLVGRPDHADFAKRRYQLQGGLVIGGVVVLAVATFMGFLATLDHCERAVNDPLYGECVQMNRTQDRNRIVRVALLLGGGGLAMSALLVNPHPAPPEEMRRLADEYNRALRNRLTAGREKRSGLRLQAVPYAAPGGGGLVLRGAF